MDSPPDRKLQVSDKDGNCKPLVKRSDVAKEVHATKREARFSIIDKPVVKSFISSSVDISPFVSEWIRRNRNYKFKEDVIERLATGLAKEAELLGQVAEGNFLACRIREYKDAPHDAVAKLCVTIYTEDSWIYKTVNAALREGNMTKVDTLGPFCYFIQSYLSTPHKKEKGEVVVYRGMDLTAKDIDLYKLSIGQVKSWLSFASTSRDKAQAFNANTLFIIRFDGESSQRFPGRDISSLSKYPAEEEVLLCPGADFHIEKVEENVGVEKKTIIHLSLM